MHQTTFHQLSSVQNPPIIQLNSGWLRTGFPYLGMIRIPNFSEGS